MYNKLIAATMLVVLTATAIVGCVVTYNYPAVPRTSQIETGGCDIFIPPPIGDLPPVPTVSRAVAKDREKSDNILVGSIKELREYSRERESLWERAYTRYKNSCR